MKLISQDNRRHCEGCPLDKRRRPYEVEGPPDARFVVVADAPTLRNAEQRRMMSREAMGVFTKAMQKERFGREDFALMPQVRCAYDPDNYTTKEKRLIQSTCRPYMVDDIKRIAPDVVIPLGVEAAKQVLGKAIKITKVRGIAERSEEHKALVLPMLNPLQVVLYPQHASTFASDAATLGRLVDHGYSIAKASRSVTGEYELVDDLQFLIDQKPTLISFDTENSSLRWYDPKAKILTMQFSTEEGKAYMLPWKHPDMPRTARQISRLKKQLIQLLCRDEVTVVGQNLKYDALFLWMETGIVIRIGGDTLMMAALLDENALTKNLDDLTRRFVPAMAGYADRFNATVDKTKMEELPLDNNFVDYGCGDADATLRLYKVLLPLLQKDASLFANYTYVTLPGLNAFRSIETRGMFVDEDEVLTFEAFMQDKVNASYRSLLAQVPRPIKRDHVEKGLKFSRGDFVRDILFDHPNGFRLKPKVFTKGTAKLKDETRRVASTSSKDHLPFFYEDCPFTFELAQYIKDERLLGTNVIGFKNKYIHDGKVRPVYRMDVAVTGRCLPGDARVVTNYGSMSMLDIGRFLHERDTSLYVLTHRNLFRKVTDFVPNGRKTLYQITTTDGYSLSATDNHPFLTPTGWLTVSELRAGMKVVTYPFNYSRDTREEWVPIAGYPSHEVSNMGRIRNAQKGALVLPYAKGEWGHVRVRLQRGGKDISVHRLVCLAFHGEPPPGMECMHLNGIPADNRASNLRWGTSTENGQVMVAHGRSRRGERSNQAILDDTDVARIRELSDAGLSQSEIGRMYSVSRAYVSTLVNGVRRAAENITPFTISTVSSVVQKNEALTYDISVEDDHSFICENFVVHNTSSEDPNGQNYPKRGEAAIAYRRLFIAAANMYFLEADLSQAELRIAANMANDPTMLGIYRSGGDIHRTTALIVTGMSERQFNELPPEEQKLARFKAKAVNFGFLYGMGWRKFIVYARTQYGVTFTEREAQRIREQFFETYYMLPEWHRSMREIVNRLKMVRSYSGRIRHLPMIDSLEEGIRSEAERQAINSPVQEFASTLGTMALSRMEHDVDPEYLEIVSFVHDAIYCYVPQQYLEWGAKTLKRYMETNPIYDYFGHRLKVAIEADVSFGLNLGEMKELKGLKLDTHAPTSVRGRMHAVDNRYDFSKFWDEEKGTGILVPRQLTPLDSGRRKESLYTEWREAA